MTGPGPSGACPATRRSRPDRAVKIKPYEDAAFADVVALWDACGLTVPWNDPAKDIAYLQRAANARLFLGYLEDKLIGTAMAGDDGHRGWLYFVAVDPDRQGKGHGRALVRHAEAWLRARGLPRVQFMIRETNASVREFYARLGYDVIPRFVMQRRLDAELSEAGPRQIEVVITYLQMTTRPMRPTIAAPPGHLALLRLENPSVNFYRYLYNTVGEPWFWWERRLMDDETLRAAINEPKVEIYVLYIGGEPAGYAELDRRKAPDIGLAYFGLAPRFIGRGYGTYFLNWAVDQCWSYEPKRLIVDTCTFDDPRALRTYQKAGFAPYKQERKTIVDPRSLGLIPAGVEPRQP